MLNNLGETSLIQRYNAVLSYPVSKTVEDVGCDYEPTLSWAVAGKNSLKNVNSFSLNQLVFGEAQIFLSL